MKLLQFFSLLRHSTQYPILQRKILHKLYIKKHIGNEGTAWMLTILPLPSKFI